jgi:hypothetical protein
MVAGGLGWRRRAGLAPAGWAGAGGLGWRRLVASFGIALLALAPAWGRPGSLGFVGSG